MNTRRKWLETMLRIASPVLRALAEDRLREVMPIESKSPREDRAQFTYLEAFGRTMVGMAPWLGLEGLTGEEGVLQAEYRALYRRCLHNAVTPGTRDCMNFSAGMQPIVDAAFLAHAILRAPGVLWEELDPADQRNLVVRMKETRTRRPYVSNWLLFSAMIECFLYYAGESDWDPMRVDYAVRQHFDWYLGDGFFGDGPEFHMDFYNSYVIQPMLIDVLRTVGHTDAEWQRFLPRAERYGARYAAFLERLIAPDGSYPVLGRSSAYRFGCFQMLAQQALQRLPESGLTPAQVRCGLTAVIDRVMAFDNFDADGFLRVGVCGSQPDMGEGYISTGSLYLCMAAFLPLGLPETDAFWAAPDEGWTQAKMWQGLPMSAEHAI
ncbi:MAG: DUF2264 domain-containing protein [Clostridia bacterium]|nr:DUF2264 domain-containing protein [Clostridia bacterium]